MTRPQPLTRKEWLELAAVPEIAESFGVDPGDEEAFIDSTFAAKFDYISDGPGYAGDLFVLLGGEPECPPVIVIRSGGKLAIADADRPETIELTPPATD